MVAAIKNRYAALLSKWIHERVGEEYRGDPCAWKRAWTKKDKKDRCLVLVEGIKSRLEAVPKSADFTLWCHSNYIRMRLMLHCSETCSGA